MRGALRPAGARTVGESGVAGLRNPLLVHYRVIPPWYGAD